VTAVVLMDGWMYLWHRLNHRLPWLWRFHAVHHADAEMDATSAVRFHTGEIALSSVARLAVLPLLGLSVGQVLLYEALLLPVILFHHSNVRVPAALDRVLRLVIVTPWMHWVHHSEWRPETDSNFSSVLSVWDRLFGSFRLRERPGEIRLGLGMTDEHAWRTLPGMLAMPFRPREQAGTEAAD
jgi:sterol desaturase/sphingolipid hydroxylase (fatty acid hydroxylase superfamily)